MKADLLIGVKLNFVYLGGGRFRRFEFLDLRIFNFLEDGFGLLSLLRLVELRLDFVVSDRPLLKTTLDFFCLLMVGDFAWATGMETSRDSKG